MKYKKTSELDKLCWGTDAGFYRLLPKDVFHPANEDEIIEIIKFVNDNKRHLTFRAAGTSLSGQAISDDVLVVVGKKWEKYEVLDGGKKIKLQPGIIGNRVNEILKPYKRKFSPDPASVKSAMVGGIISNNASGMSCGVHANSDAEIISAKIIFQDGTLLDTGSEESKNSFRKSHPNFIEEIESIRKDVVSNSNITSRIKKKYSIKNVTGLNIKPFIEHTDPFDIITHLMVGAEGTLAFLAEATLKTGEEYLHQASAMVYFDNVEKACNSVVKLKSSKVSAVEFFDYKALQSVNNLLPEISQLNEGACALLIKIEDNTIENLQSIEKEVLSIIAANPTIFPVKFEADEAIYSKFWTMRSGIFPSVGSMRPIGTTCLIEDVAFPIESLTEATIELQEILEKYEYHDAVIYGHALDGNYHFIINQSFNSDEDVARYENMMNDVIELVVVKHDGSLKAEHGTGRNMAPFVEKEWGTECFNIMKRVKTLFDPNNIFNKGVIFNEDPNCHISNLKPLPRIHPIVDKCIECGFCEVNCVSCGLTLSSRQRIIAQREIGRLKATKQEPERLKELIREFDYWGNQTCAGDGLCSTSCPIKINTGEFIHVIREENNKNSNVAQALGRFTGNNLGSIESTLKVALWSVDLVRNIIGNKAMLTLATTARKVSCNTLPQWSKSLPTAAKKAKPTAKSDLKVVYFPSCINQTMGVSESHKKEMPLMQKTVALLEKAGYEVIFPENMKNLCCGTIWESKGIAEMADKKSAELEAALKVATNNGKYPVLCDQSPCVYRMKHEIKTLDIYEPIEFIDKFLLDKLKFTPIEETITLHATCSTIKMGLKGKLIDIANMCATKVVVPAEVGCCGFAGDKGFTHPELNKFALRKLKPVIEANKITTGYSNSRTCEIGLETNGGIPFMNIMYLVDKATTKI